MNLSSALKSIALSLSASAALFAIPHAANAETSASIAFSNFYLFRGDNFSGSAPAVSGSLDYAHASGAYGGVWVSNEGKISSQETDYYIGYAGAAGDFEYDINLTAYQYPEADGVDHYGDTSELILNFGFQGFSFMVADSLQGAGNDGAYVYYNFGYSWEQFGINYGMHTNDSMNPEPTHLDVSFAATEELVLTATVVVDDDDDNSFGTDPLFNVAWSKTFDL